MAARLDPQPILAGLRGLFCREAGRPALLQYAAERIRAAGPPYTSVYLYMLQDDELVLEAFSGRVTDHTRIPVGKGVCGTAVASGMDQNEADVRAVSNYLACNAFTRSELVVLIRRGDAVLGQIDVDSDQIDPFTADEQSAVRAVAEALAVLL
jgi:GAF domain-containing protein